MLSISQNSGGHTKADSARFSGMRRLPLLTILAAVILATGCGQSGGDAIRGNSTGQSGSSVSSADQPEESTAQREENDPASGPETRQEEKEEEDDSNGAEARAGDARAGDGGARAGDASVGGGQARAGNVVAGDGEGGESDARAEAGAGGGSRAGSVRLRISGSPDAEFSGTCRVNGEEQDVSGQPPERFVYRPKGGGLECNIRSDGSGRIEVSLTSKGTRAVQGIQAGQGSINLTYAASGVSVTSR